MLMKGTQHVFVMVVMCLHEEAKTGVRVDYEWSRRFIINVGILQASGVVTFLFNIVVDVVSEF